MHLAAVLFYFLIPVLIVATIWLNAMDDDDDDDDDDDGDGFAYSS